MLVRLMRALAVCWAVASATMPGTLAVAEAFAETASAEASPDHVEAPGLGACAVAHHSDCAVCSLLRYGAAVPSGSPAPEWGRVAGTGTASSRDAPTCSAGHRPGRPRAPPAA